MLDSCFSSPSVSISLISFFFFQSGIAREETARFVVSFCSISRCLASDTIKGHEARASRIISRIRKGNESEPRSGMVGYGRCSFQFTGETRITTVRTSSVRKFSRYAKTSPASVTKRATKPFYFYFRHFCLFG